MILKRAAALVLSMGLICSLSAAANAQEVCLGGQAVGIELTTAGVFVAGVTDVETPDGTKCPAKTAGVKPGDIIVSLGGADISSSRELLDAVSRLDGSPAELTLLRDGKKVALTVTPVRSSEEQWMLGMWLRDGVSGVGTLTYYDPDSNTYGALGHSVTDSDTGIALPLGSGSITGAEIVGVVPGASGTPGELKCAADSTRSLGSIDANTVCGIFGTAYEALGGETVETGKPAPGEAELITTLEGHESRAYSVRIDRVYTDADGTRAIITVTDPLLLSIAGGIVQGMSGSPLVQNGRLVAAVTHVFVDDPTRGCCIGIDDMLSAGESAAA